MHWPVRCKQGLDILPKLDEILPVDIKGTWRAMEACARQGLTKAIGVSNFSSKKLTDLLEFAEIAPAVNQANNLLLVFNFDNLQCGIRYHAYAANHKALQSMCLVRGTFGIECRLQHGNRFSFNIAQLCFNK